MSRREECAIETRKRAVLAWRANTKDILDFLCVFNSYKFELFKRELCLLFSDFNTKISFMLN